MSVFLFVPAWGFEFGAGLSISYGLSLTNNYVPPSTPSDMTLNHAVFSAYFDAFYARLGVGYITNLGNPSGSSGFTGNLWAAQVMISLLAKLPVVIKSFQLWTGVGAGYLLTLMMDYNGDGIDDRTADSALNDVYLLVAVGLEFKAWKILKIGHTFTINYNLTPAQTSNEPVGSTHTGFFFQFSLNVGFAF